MNGKPMPAGELREKITFAERAAVSDGGGGVEGDFSDQFTVAARIRPLKGGEEVLASRLQGTQPVIITVRYSLDTSQIAPDWRATDARKGTVYAIKSIMNTDERRRYLDILATAGVAA
jgi:SPP1 family predicted phage head-tail adaptor